jgi:hypothetical protein
VSNVYYSPEEWGLSVVGELEDPNADYSFNTLCVWVHENGTVYWAQSSGCSCPSPFEEYENLDSLNPLIHLVWNDFEDEVKNHACDWDDSPGGFQCDKLDLLRKVMYYVKPPTSEEMEAAVAGLKEIASALS